VRGVNRTGSPQVLAASATARQRRTHRVVVASNGARRCSGNQVAARAAANAFNGGSKRFQFAAVLILQWAGRCTPCKIFKPQRHACAP